METLLKIANKYINSGSRVLELGCGGGNFIRAVAKDNPEASAVCIDYYNEPKDLPPSVRFIKQNLEEFELEEKFDLIIINHVLEHIKNPLGLLEKAKKKLNKNGKILIVVPNRDGFGNEARVYLPEHGKHYFLWDRESLQYSLERLGFVCRFHNLYVAGTHNIFLKYIPALLRIKNPNLICIAMLDMAE